MDSNMRCKIKCGASNLIKVERTVASNWNKLFSNEMWLGLLFNNTFLMTLFSANIWTWILLIWTIRLMWSFMTILVWEFRPRNIIFSCWIHLFQIRHIFYLSNPMVNVTCICRFHLSYFCKVDEWIREAFTFKLRWVEDSNCWTFLRECGGGKHNSTLGR